MNFNNNELQKEYLIKKEELEKIINAPIDNTKYLWDETVQRYATNIEQIKRLVSLNEFNSDISSKLINDLNIFLNRCANPEYHIALVGAIKAGKSTLINALIGYELASTQVTPETASLTKFKSDKENFVNVSFYSQIEWSALWNSVTKSNAEVFIEEYKNLNADAEKDNWLGKESQYFRCNSKEELKNEIIKWTSSKSPTHYFVKEVTVGLKNFELPKGVVLVDTPGLDDVVEYRSNITREYIDRANAVLMCVRSDALTNGELQTIYRVFTNAGEDKAKIYVIGTQIDTLNNPKEDWQKQKNEWVKHLKGNSCYKTESLANKNIVSVSAFLYTLLKEYKNNEFTRDDDKYYYGLEPIARKFRIRDIDKSYDELKDFTNIESLKEKLQSQVISQYKKKMINDIVYSYNLCSKELKQNLIEIKNEQIKFIEMSKQDINVINNQKIEYETKLNKAREEKQELLKLIENLKMHTIKRAKELTTNIKNLNKKK